MTLAILTEKPSAGRAFGAALGGAQGTFNGESYVITSARGHLFELAQPEEQLLGGGPSEAAAMKAWNLGTLPWDISKFAWKRVPIKGASDTIKQVRSVLSKVDEIVIATDLDPTGEGDAIAWNIIDELKLHGKKFSRMEFTDEAPASLQKAFVKRRPIVSMMDEGDYRKADFRNKLDFLTMQHTRIASLAAGQNAVLRQGRLKSVMVNLVGAQLAAHTNYVKIPEYQNRFRDENDVLYINPEEPRFKTEGEVPNVYSSSKVVLDSRTDKTTAPRKLLDLAGLSARLSGKGVKADVVLATYQKMYEDQVVSYPRTEDKTITVEQFNELLPFANKIAVLVGVDPALLTERSPRKTHVKDSGAHGANRPGPKVPASMAAIEAKYGPVAPLIYEELARSYLAMLAADYRYEAQVGHLESYPQFIGKVSVPKFAGWKAVFFDADDKDDDENTKGLGTKADPLVFEIIPPRPEHPSMKWLMKQLEKRDVGTGATRTSTYADVTGTKAKYPLLKDARGKITMSEFGDMSYRLLPGTQIGDLTTTEQVYGVMRDIAAGTTSTDDALAVVADWVRADIVTMQRNAATMHKDLGLAPRAAAKEKIEGVWAKTGQPVKFAKEWSGHVFTDHELQELLAGNEITFTAISAKSGNEFQAKGSLDEQVMEKGGKKYAFVGFKPDFSAKASGGSATPPRAWCSHVFTAAEIKDLIGGKKIYIDDFMSKKGATFAATVSFGVEKGSGTKKIIPHFG
ncbi:DNA topoisomerase-3 [Plantibacter flavus]|uniref:DNA topoisomerase-3 n=1 Tax=Plantibacter flavus TaxID=150123 RepID=A0A3N2BLB6_9MICO|nr:DNA topoisomerase [Plantibacter flavus]ROR75962.1 DNA topoisomerase-3 [Plantibacter flavus]SMG48252.1 DNA topoisomerase-3 [Plantibacter flavus]